MTPSAQLEHAAGHTLKSLLDAFSVEITTRDEKGLEVAAASLDPGREVFIASLPNDDPDRLVRVSRSLLEAGLTPVPHLVARNFASRDEFKNLSRRLGAIGTRRALVIAGDRDVAAGPFSSSTEIIRAGTLAKAGFTHTFFAVHPEGHPRVDVGVLRDSLLEKVAVAEAQGHLVEFVGQFGFNAAAPIALATYLEAQGLANRFRIGVAGPASRASLVKFALLCGVSGSLRALRERQDMAKNVLMGETPEALLQDVADAIQEGKAGQLRGVHFFTFGGMRKSVEFISALRAAQDSQ